MYKSVKEVINSVISQSSVHGIPRILSSKHRYQRVLWLCLVLGTFGVLVHQLYQLFCEYKSYPIKTKVSMKRETLRFPAVSFCNLNAMKTSQMKLINETKLYELIMPDESDSNDDEMGNQMNNESNNAEIDYTDFDSIEYFYDDEMIDPMENQMNNESNNAEIDNTDFNYYDEMGNQMNNESNNAEIDYTDFDSIEYFYDDEMIDPMENQMNNESNNAEIDNTDFYYYDYFNFFNFWYYSNDYDTNLYEDDTLNDQSSFNQFINYEKGQQELKNDPRSEKVKVFKNLFQNMSKSTRKELGHRIEDLLIECSFNGKQCSSEDFTLFQSLDFGNCYTLESNLFIARRLGPMNGLQMILQVENFEQKENFLDGSGVRLVIHEPGTLPFPEEEGFTLSPGYETSIGMKMVALSRSKPPYGNCSEGESFYQTYGVRYTMSTCLHICRNINVIEICKCLPSENIVDIDYMDQFYSLPVCSLVENNKTKKHNFKKKTCEEYVFYQIEENKINCGCESACRETVYKNTLSGRVWPKDSYYTICQKLDKTKNLIFLVFSSSYTILAFMKDELLNLTCSKSNHSYCSEYDSDDLKYINLKDNFLKTVIYYEDLNFEEISEEPLYDGFRFLSDIGGTLGLFLGASILSFVELVQLMVEILYYFRYKCLKNKPAMKKNRIQVEPV